MRQACEDVSERLDTRRTAIIFHLDAAEKVVKSLLVGNRLGDAGRRKIVNKAFRLEVARYVALNPHVLTQVVGDGGVKTVKVPALAKEPLKVRADHVASRAAAQIGEGLSAAAGSKAGAVFIGVEASQRVAAVNLYLVIVIRGLRESRRRAGRNQNCQQQSSTTR